MTQIIPAIMPTSLDDLESKVAMVRGAAEWVQVDVMDGKFVPSCDWPFPNFETEVAPLLHEDMGLPLWEDVNYEFDLMIDEPENFVEKFVRIGGGRIIIHYETAEKDKIWEAVRMVQEMNTEVAIAIDTVTPNEVLDEFITDERPIDFVQLMGIAKIGYQGNPFDERVIPKIEALKAKYPDIIISIDGGVNFETAPLLVDAGADRLVSGSVILKSENPRETIEDLESI